MHFFSRSKGSSTRSPDADASASTSCICHTCAIHGPIIDNTSATPAPEPTPTPTVEASNSTLTPEDTPAATPIAAHAPSPTESANPQSHKTRDNLLNGVSITLSVLEQAGAMAHVPFMKEVAKVTKDLVGLIQTVLQNNKMLRELIQEAIGLGGCVIDAINACFTPGEPLPDVFQQHVILLLDTLTEVRDLSLSVLKDSKSKKTLNVKAIRGKVASYERRIKSGLDYFQLRSNISVEAHFAKWNKFLDERFPLGGFTPPPPTPVQNISNIDNSQRYTLNAPVNTNSFVCTDHGVQIGQGNQVNVIGMGSSSTAGLDPQAIQRMIRDTILPMVVPVRV